MPDKCSSQAGQAIVDMQVKVIWNRCCVWFLRPSSISWYYLKQIKKLPFSILKENMIHFATNCKVFSHVLCNHDGFNLLRPKKNVVIILNYCHMWNHVFYWKLMFLIYWIALWYLIWSNSVAHFWRFWLNGILPMSNFIIFMPRRIIISTIP